MKITNKTGYLGMVLMLAAFSTGGNQAEAAQSPAAITIPERVARIKQVLKQQTESLERQSPEAVSALNQLDGQQIEFWGDWGDRGRRRGGRGGWLDAWGPGWGDWGDSSRWGDFGDIW